LYSSASIRRLRRICYNLRSRFSKTNDDLASQNNVVEQLERTVSHLQGKAEKSEKLENDLVTAQDELSRKTRDLQETHVKMNDNYKLVAELSNENLKLTGDKSKAEEVAEDLKRDQIALRGELNSAQRVLEQLNYSRNSGVGGVRQWQRNTKYFYPTSMAPPGDRSMSGSVSALEMSPSTPHRSFSQQQPQQPPQQSRGYHRGHRKGGRRYNRQNQLQHGAESEHDKSEQSVVTKKPFGITMKGKLQSIFYLQDSARYPQYRQAPLAPPGMNNPVTLMVPQGTAASDISSPDLGVDVSSDPFSSLERTTNNVPNVYPRTAGKVFKFYH
jgi:hypothetical protein